MSWEVDDYGWPIGIPPIGGKVFQSKIAKRPFEIMAIELTDRAYRIRFIDDHSCKSVPIEFFILGAEEVK